MAGSFSLWLFAVSMGASALGGMLLGMASGIFHCAYSLTMFGHVEIHHSGRRRHIVSVITCLLDAAEQHHS